MSKGTIYGLSGALAFCVLLIIGLIIGLVIESNKTASTNSQPHINPYEYRLSQDSQASAALGQRLQQEIAQNGLENMKLHMHHITEKVISATAVCMFIWPFQVHIAGTQEQMDVLSYLAETYSSYGLRVKTIDYDVMLSYPNYSNPNTVSMQLANGDWSPISSGLGDAPKTGPKEMIDQITRDKRALNWWNAYGADGSATGTLVYANYGRIQDFDVLNKRNISLVGKIAVIRYGELFRGDKVHEAWRHGAIAVIIFTDPIDYGSPDLSNTTNVFPNSAYMPPGGAQRGSLLNVDGDPLTPLYPSKSYTYRLTEQNVTNGVSVPTIPVMPMGYRDAVNLFLNMDGPPVPADWQGGISGVNYTFTSSKIFKVTVHATRPRRTIRDVIAFMPGSTEPDKYVLLTNHVDAWTYGAMDPNFGTTAILETARALTTVAKATGWRPKRTIVFCSVDAEEFGLIGSTEFAEEYLKVLQQRAVSLINIDVAVKGHVTLLATATPSLYQTLIRAAKTVPNPNDGEVALGRKTVYDSWINYFPNNSFVAGQPFMKVPDSGSDQSTFLSFVGIPSAYLTYFCDPTIKRDCYELYHTMFEVPWSIENYIDPGYKALTAMAQLWTEIARDLSDSLIIPFNVNDYASVLSLAVKRLDVYLKSKTVPNLISTYSTIMNDLVNSTERFTAAGNSLQALVDDINLGKKSATLRQVEILNSRLMGLERTFINDRGLYPEREAARHVLFATSIHDHYSGTMGAGIYDSVEYYFDAVQDSNVAQENFWLQRIEITISELQYGIESAILLMDISDY